MNELSPALPNDSRPAASSLPPARVIPSSEIFQGDDEVLVQHGDQTYRLRITRANRLILNK